MENLSGKCVVLGITGGIAAYKMATVASGLKKAGCDVHVIMTKNATEFISPLTFETLTGNRCVTDTFDRNFKYDVEHISLAKAADLIVVAPATANIIAKMASGIADDMLTTVVLAAKCKKLFAPAMNTAMLENRITQDNIMKLMCYDFGMIRPESGRLACGDSGSGKLADPETILSRIEIELAREKDMKGLKVTVTAGPTVESIDPVRYITNHSTGKMGFALAYEAMLRGAEVTLILGPTNIKVNERIKVIDIKSAEDMYNAVANMLDNTDILIKAAAVADYTPVSCADDKLKKSDDDMSISLKRTKDILGWVSENKHEGLYVCGFSMETKDMIENSRKKLDKKKLDMIVANNLKTEGAGFGVDTNVVTIITKDEMKELPLMSKSEVSKNIIDEILLRRK